MAIGPTEEIKTKKKPVAQFWKLPRDQSHPQFYAKSADFRTLASFVIFKDIVMKLV